jgi:hypothetical protein
MFWRRKTDGPSNQSDRERFAFLADLAASPEKWASLNDATLASVFSYMLAAYAYGHQFTMIFSLHMIYPIVGARLPVHLRMSQIESFVTGIEEGKTDINALLPFIRLDPDPAVVSSATLASATLFELIDNDPLTGPRQMLEASESFMSSPDDQVRAAWMIHGLVLLGDARVAALLSGIWDSFDLDVRAELAEIQPTFVHKASIDFFLDWLENADLEDIDAPLEALARLGIAAGRPGPTNGVHEIRRRFPAHHKHRDGPIEHILVRTQQEAGRDVIARARACPSVDDDTIRDLATAWGLP